MKVDAPRVAPSPSGPGRVRLGADVTYASGTPEGETLWFEAPAALEGALVSTGDPWLVLLAPLAMTLGEELEVEAPVDPGLVQGVRRAAAVWEGWFPELRVPGLDVRTDGAAPPGRPHVGDRERPPTSRGTRDGTSAAAPARPADAPTGGRTAALFSGGVDSFFTVLRHQEGHHTDDDGPRAEISDLLTLGGADVAVGDTGTLDALVDHLRPVAEELGKRLVFVTTNARETRWRSADWTRLSHGALLAAAGLALGRRWDRVLIPSSLPLVRSQLPWGSHPFVDPLFSTAGTRIEDDGARFPRTEKTARVAGSELALRTLRVCWVDGAVGNCGRCGKCQRTMATLEVVGALDACPAFPSGSFSLEGLARLRVEAAAEARMLGRAATFARQRGRPDVARALDEAVRGSFRRQGMVRWARKLDELGLPTRLAGRLEAIASRGWVR